MKSYSSHTVPPEPLGMRDGVPTSKTLQPQAQAEARLGANAMTKRAAIREPPNQVNISNRYVNALGEGALAELRRINFSRRLRD
jgi:hypothetical protein